MEDQENNNTINRNNTDGRKECYKNLLNEIDEIQESNDVGIQTVRRIKHVLNEVNLLNDQCDIRERVKCPEEILLDSFVLSSASNVLVKCTKAVDVFAANYEPIGFASKIIETIKTYDEVEQLDFVKLLGDARDIIPNTIKYSFLYGTFEPSKIPEPKEKKQRVVESQQRAAKKELIEVKNTQNEEEVDEDSVIFLLKILQNEYKQNGEKPLKYYDFVMDTNNFATTVENMFYCSFLIRDGKASLCVTEDGVPIIRPTSKKELKLFRRNNGVNTQAIISLEIADWDRLRSKEGHIQKQRRTK